MSETTTLAHSDVAATLVAVVREPDVVVAALGTNVFELYGAGDRHLNYYTWGGMGLAASVGLGFALRRPDRRVVVLDGDGALLMNPNALFAIGRGRPANLLHVVCDNRAFSTTGGQKTGSETIRLTDLATVFNYSWAREARSLQDVHTTVLDFVTEKEAGPGFLHVPVHVSTRHVKPVPDPLFHKYRFLAALAATERSVPQRAR